MVDINMTIVAQMINFVILLAILKKLAFGPLMKVLDEREAKIRNTVAAAEESEQKARELMEEYQQKLDEAKTQAQDIVNKAMKRAAEESEATLNEAREEIDRMRKSAQDQIIREREVAIAQLKGEVVTLSMAAAAKIIGANMNQDANKKLVGDFIEKLDKEKIGGLPC